MCLFYNFLISYERNKKESRHFYAGTLMAANTFAKIEIFFQIGEIKMGIFVKSYHYDM
jgi:hypothetical protein